MPIICVSLAINWSKRSSPVPTFDICLCFSAGGMKTVYILLGFLISKCVVNYKKCIQIKIWRILKYIFSFLVYLIE